MTNAIQGSSSSPEPPSAEKAQWWSFLALGWSFLALGWSFLALGWSFLASRLLFLASRLLFFLVLFFGWLAISVVLFIFLRIIWNDSNLSSMLPNIFYPSTFLRNKFLSNKDRLDVVASFGLILVLGLNFLHFWRLFIRRCANFGTKQDSDCVQKEYKSRQATIKEENELITTRIGWLLTAETILFAAFGLAVSKEGAIEKPEDVIGVLSFVGIVVAASTMIVLDGADAAIVERSTVKDYKKVIGDLGGWKWGLLAWLAPWRLFPPMFIMAWYLIAYPQIKQEAKKPDSPPSLSAPAPSRDSHPISPPGRRIN